MDEQHADVVIVGCGGAGSAAAWQLARRGIQGLGDGGRMAGQDAPGLGEPHPTARFRDQGQAQPGFEPIEVLAHRGLAVAERPGGGSDGAELVDAVHDAKRVGIYVECTVDILGHPQSITWGY